MKIELKNRFRRIARLPTVLLLLALSAGFASVGQAQDIPVIVVTAERPTICASALTRDQKLRNAIRSGASHAVWKTRVSVATDLGVKLNSRQRPFRVAGKDAHTRG